MDTSLSKYYPLGTSYFYGFPAGEDSKFFNQVPPWKEELVSARPMVCAGDGVRIVTFAPTTERRICCYLNDELGTPLIKRDNIIELPTSITADIAGEERNKRVKEALLELVPHGSLVMAQPYLDEKLRPLFQIAPEICNWLNDKKNMLEYIPYTMLPQRYTSYPNGKGFVENADKIPFPCVVKVSSSSSGDGVRICRNQEELMKAKEEFGQLTETIYIEEFIDAVYNLGVQFGIPSDPREPIAMIGFNEQLVTEAGEYLGGTIDSSINVPILPQIYEAMLTVILPKIREKGWYGMGGFDVLVDKEGRFFFIDSNLRMTAITAYLCQLRSRKFKRPIATFTGVFKGTQADFERVIVPLAIPSNPVRKLNIITLVHAEQSYRFNAGFFFDDKAEIPARAKELRELGIESSVLDRLQTTKLRS